jgi:hypothetical protein
LQVPPQELASRLDVLLADIASIATPEVALAFTKYNNRLIPL